MRIAIIGNRGQLGHDLAKAFAAHDLFLLDKEEMDVTDASHVAATISGIKPDVMLNCSAFLRVDDCEDMVDITYAVNLFGVHNLATAARAAGATLVHYSTDYVFGGPGDAPHPESSLPRPGCVYATSKLAGEHLLAAVHPKHIIIRTCGLYGYTGSREKGTNFVEMMIGLARQGKPLKIVADQICTPTSTAELARATVKLVEGGKYGLFHLTAAGECSWHEFAVEIFRLMNLTPEVSPVTSDHYPTRAKRPPYSALDNAAYRAHGFKDLLPWREALAEYIAGRAANGRD